jgi:hypothetical protein
MIRLNIRNRLESEKRRTKLNLVEFEMLSVLNSSNFKKALLELARYCPGELSEWRTKTPEEIVQHFFSGREVLEPTEDKEFDIYVDNFFSWRGVIGYTNRNTKWMFVNTRFFDRNSTRSIGSNIIHEYGHKIGFEHHFKRTSVRPLSLCYLLNKAYSRAHKEIYGQAKTARVKRIGRKKPWYKIWGT